ncbi:aminoglycoside phosphotransferase family protein [Microlunatus panaciterrae]|nr:aminoglycoside phosphotransferase family protein [Microlunatus panaciterrae]
MPRWWQGGGDWLDALPSLVADHCRRLQLELDGPPRHGSNALVVPVRRNGELLALRLTPPTDDVAAEVAALRFWDGRGTVRLIDADVAAGVTLLERLDGSRSLNDLPLTEAVPVLGRMMRRLAVPGPPEVLSTTAVAAARLGDLEESWSRLDRPFSRTVLDVALTHALALAETSSTLAVNGDLHYEQVLAGRREPWLTVDPVLMRGDIEYDLARMLWSRLDEMSDDAVFEHFHTLVDQAELCEERAYAWVVLRSVDYWVWGLDHGLTEDPVRCARLVGLFLSC